MKILSVINPGAGSIENLEEMKFKLDSFVRYYAPDASHKVLEINKNEEGKLIEEMNGENPDKVLICGGDGTISRIINQFHKKEFTFAVVPLGTFNHFSKDNNIPQDMEEAVKIAFHGKENEIDIAQVNGRIILNNSSIGIYPKTVIQRKNFKYNKLLKVAAALFIVLVKFPVYRLSLKTERKEFHVKTSFIFVGNNFYNLNLTNIGTRDSVEKGILSIYFSKSSSRLSFLKFALRLLFNKLKESGEFEAVYSKSLTIESDRRIIDVSVDGEIIKMNPPLQFKILQKKIKLMAP